VQVQDQLHFSLTLEHIDPSASRVVNTTRAISYWDNALYECTRAFLNAGQIEPRLLDILANDRLLESDDKRRRAT
jgi:hypothetical protein